MSILSKPYFHNEAAAFAHVESLLWPRGTVCPHCKSVANAGKLNGVRTKPSRKHPEGKKRHGLYKCKNRECRKQFTVRINTIFEESHLPMTKWLQAMYLMASSKKGVSAHQIHRTLEVQYKTAWFLCHRIREAMRTGNFDAMGGKGKIVESDETFLGKKEGTAKRRGYGHKMVALSLVERGGNVRSFVIDKANKAEIAPIVNANIHHETWLLTDEAKHYVGIGKAFRGHLTVNHSLGEYVDTDEPTIHTNTIENYFSVFKRGMKVVYQHCREKHLHRYLAEFDFRYNRRIGNGIDDNARFTMMFDGVSGKRLTYGAAYK